VKRARLGFLLAILAGAVLGTLRAQGVFEWVTLKPLVGKLDLGHGVTAERRDLAKAKVTIVTVPREGGARLRALLTDSERQRLVTVSEVASREGALAAINGDYHQLSGFAFATTYSTLVDEGFPRVIGPRDAASFWIGTDGVAHVGSLDLGCSVRLPSGEEIAAHLNVPEGDVTVLLRPPGGDWEPAGYEGVPIAVEGSAYRVQGPLAARLSSQALLGRKGSAAREKLAGLKVGDLVGIHEVGAQAGKVRLAIGTGPRLLEGGAVTRRVLEEKTNRGWLNRLPRTAVGLDATRIFLVTTVIEGRNGLSLADLAAVLRDLGCTDATNLDGGPSVTLWAAGHVVNAIDSVPDPVASALLVLPPAR
jgi:hypothetical protein